MKKVSFWEDMVWWWKNDRAFRVGLITMGILGVLILLATELIIRNRTTEANFGSRPAAHSSNEVLGFSTDPTQSLRSIPTVQCIYGEVVVYTDRDGSRTGFVPFLEYFKDETGNRRFYDALLSLNEETDNLDDLILVRDKPVTLPNVVITLRDGNLYVQEDGYGEYLCVKAFRNAQ